MYGLPGQLLAELLHNRRRAVPDILVIKGGNVDACGVIGDQLLAKEAIRLGPNGAVDLDMDHGAHGEELPLHDLGCRGGQDNGGRATEGGGGGGAGEAGIAAGGAVEMGVLAVGSDGAGHEGADAAGFERAAWLEVVQFEVDIAGQGRVTVLVRDGVVGNEW